MRLAITILQSNEDDEVSVMSAETEAEMKFVGTAYTAAAVPTIHQYKYIPVGNRFQEKTDGARWNATHMA